MSVQKLETLLEALVCLLVKRVRRAAGAAGCQPVPGPSDGRSRATMSHLGRCCFPVSAARGSQATKLEEKKFLQIKLSAVFGKKF